MNFFKKRQNITSVLILVIGISTAVLVLDLKKGNSQDAFQESQNIAPIAISVQSAKDSRSLKYNIEYPAVVAGDQEIEVNAKANGTATAINFNLGDKVAKGSLLVKIDDIGNNLDSSEKGFQSSQVQQSRLSADQAEEALNVAEKFYKNLKKEYDKQKKDPTLSKTVSKAQVDSAKGQIDIAELQLESAKIGFKSTLDDHLIVSPICGTITKKSVSSGDSISVGQSLFAISQTNNLKLQFYVDQSQLGSIVKGMEIKVMGNSEQELFAVVKNISPQADPVTRRFLIEAIPQRGYEKELLAGTIVTVSFWTVKNATVEGSLILPLSAITVGQNENYIFLAENGKAKKIGVSIETVGGESAQIKANILENDQIIIQGSKVVQDGRAVEVRNQQPDN